MAATKPIFYISMIFVSSLIFMGILIVGNDFALNPNINLDNDSLEYISEYSGYLSDSGVTNYDTNIDELKQDNILADNNETGRPSITDFLANLNWYKSKVEPTMNFFKLSYNLPNLFITTLGLDLGQFDPYISTTVNVIWVALILVAIKMVRG